MRLDYTIWMYILIVFALLLVLLRTGANFLNSLMFTLIIGLLFLLITKPPFDIDDQIDDISSISIYFTVVFLSLLSIIFYTGITSWHKMYDKK